MMMDIDLTKPEQNNLETRKSTLRDTERRNGNSQKVSKNAHGDNFLNSSYNYTDKNSSKASLMSDSKGSLMSTTLSMAKTSTLNGSYMDIEMTPARRAKIAEFENQTIQKQRNELHLMIAELKGRDRELNDMVTAHQKQLIAWERDRKHILTLDEKCARLEKEICLKNDEIRSLAGQIRVAETKDLNKSAALRSTQEELARVTEQQTHINMQKDDLKQQIRDLTEQHSLATMEIADLEEKNRSLTKSVMELNSTIGQFDTREQELIMILKLKDKDLSESATRIQETSAKFTKIDNQLEQSKRSENESRRTSSDWKNKYNQTWKEYDFLKREYRKSEQQNTAYKNEIKRLKQELAGARKEVVLAGEREKRKDDVLDLQRSKQDRSELELTTLRDLYEQQQRDVAVLHHNLENTKLIVDQQQNRIMQQRKKEIEAETSVKLQQYRSTSPISYTRSKSPASRSPTRASSRSSYISSRSPTRIDKRSRSPGTSVSPSRIRARSPGISYNSSVRSRSPEYRARSPQYRARSPTSRSADKYYSTSSPTKTQSSAISSYSSRIPRYDASEKEDFSYSYQKEMPHLESSGYYSKSYTSSSLYGRDAELPYKSYSVYDDKKDYSASHWSSTKALAHSADEIINKYYPMKDHHSEHYLQSQNLEKQGDEEQENESQQSTPRDNREENGSKKDGSVHSSERGSHTGSGAVNMNQITSSDPLLGIPAGSNRSVDSGSVHSAHSLTKREDNSQNLSNSSGSSHSQQNGGFPGFSSNQYPGFDNNEVNVGNQIRDVLSPVPPFEPVADRDRSASNHTTPRSKVTDTDTLSEKSEGGHSIHSSAARSDTDSQKAESVHSVHSRSETASQKAESLHSVHSSTAKSDAGSQRAASIRSVHSNGITSDTGSQRVEREQSIKVDKSDIGSERTDSVHSSHSGVGGSENHSGSVKLNGFAAPGSKTNSQISAADLQDAQELEDMFSSQPSKVEIRPDSTTPTNDVPALDLLAEDNTHESPRTQFEKLQMDTSEIEEDLEKSIESNQSLNASLQSANSSLKDTGKNGGTMTMESFDGVD